MTPQAQERPQFRRVPKVWLVLAVLALMLAAARCGRNVSLGVDPDSGVAKAVDGGAQ
jgi:hypothetical protein